MFLIIPTKSRRSLTHDNGTRIHSIIKDLNSWHEMLLCPFLFFKVIKNIFMSFTLNEMSKFIFCCISTLSFLFMGFLPVSLIHGQENEVTQAVKQSESIGVLIHAHGTHHVHGEYGSETPKKTSLEP